MCDSIAVTRDKSKNQKYKRSKAERMALWCGEKIVDSKKFGQTTKVGRNPAYSLASTTHRQHSPTHGGNFLQKTAKTLAETTFSSVMNAEVISIFKLLGVEHLAVAGMKPLEQVFPHFLEQCIAQFQSSTQALLSGRGL